MTIILTQLLTLLHLLQSWNLWVGTWWVFVGIWYKFSSIFMPFWKYSRHLLGWWDWSNWPMCMHWWKHYTEVGDRWRWENTWLRSRLWHEEPIWWLTCTWINISFFISMILSCSGHNWHPVWIDHLTGSELLFHTSTYQPLTLSSLSHHFVLHSIHTFVLGIHSTIRILGYSPSYWS